MEPKGLLFFLLSLSIAATFHTTPCDARSIKEKRALKRFDTIYTSSDLINDNYYYTGSPFYIPPYQDVMGPMSSPSQDNPSPFCVDTPLLPPTTTQPSPTYTPLSPSTILPSPTYTPLSPSTILPSPTYTPVPPTTTLPSPTYTPLTPLPPSTTLPTPIQLSPPPQPSTPSYVPSRPPPPSYIPSPPEESAPGPPEFVPGPVVFQPPVVYPPPTVPLPPPPSYTGTTPGLWCVAKPTVPDPIIQEAMNYACGSGADCDSIQPSGSCYQPATLIAHASFAFNSYWQRTKVAGGTCEFGGTAMLVTKDPSYDGCHFIVY